jgi:hypothetical protein
MFKTLCLSLAWSTIIGSGSGKLYPVSRLDFRAKYKFPTTASLGRTCNDLVQLVLDQSDIDFYSSCPSLHGQFLIDPTFAGAFNLPGVKSLGSFEVGYYDPALRGDNHTLDGVTSVSMPDLETASGFMAVAYLGTVSDISFP